MLSATLALPAAQGALAQSAGRVLAAVGEVAIVRDGRELPAAANAEVRSGDLLRTGTASNMQVRLDDASLIALRPRTEFRLDEFKFSGKEDGSESGLFSLLRGGFRTVTGLIGRANRDRYRVTTPSATIGIRGTHFNVVMCKDDCGKTKDGLYGGVLEGKIALNNDSNIEKEFSKGDYFYVQDKSSPAEKLISPPDFLGDRLEGQAQKKKGEDKTADGPKDEPKDGVGFGAPNDQLPKEEQTLNFASLDFNYQVTEDKIGLDVQGEPLPEPIEPTPPSGIGGFAPGITSGLAVLTSAAAPHEVGTSASLHTVECDDLGVCQGDASDIITFDASGFKSVQIGGGSGFVDRNLATTAEVGSVEGVIEWGRWAGGPTSAGGWYDNLTFGENQGLHYVVGVPALPMPTSGTATFSLLGATMPTFSDGFGGGLGTGSMTAGTASVDFLRGSISADMSLVFTGTNGASNYSLTMSNGSFSPGSTSINGSGSFSYSSGAVNLCTQGCSTQFVGFFAGPNASHLGLGYDTLVWTPSETYFSINGVVVMKR